MYIVPKGGNNNIWRWISYMKKMFPKKKLSKKELVEFLDKKGFYVVLLLCILVIAATALFVTKYNIPSSNKDFDAERIIPEDFYDEFASEEEDELVSEAPIDVPITTLEKDEESDVQKIEESKTDVDEKSDEQVNQIAKVDEDTVSSELAKTQPAKAVSANVTVTKTQSDKAVSANNESKSSEVEVSSESSQQFIMPVLGEVICVFAQDRLLYSKTLDQWRAHDGIDLAAERGTPIKAVANGVVTDVKNDPRWGITVVIEHDNGLKTVYSNLASDEMVVQNEKVAQGDIIGCVGNTAAFESAEQPHLHFEVWKDNEPVNPEDYLFK
jgi:murein DD-endopeptidase MepM/ murein hydrolase activator NlpD